MNNINEIIIIQKYYRRYIEKKNILIPSSYYQTKNWRKNKKWYKTGKSNECEIYQINLIEKIINVKLNKTNDRINTETNNIVDNRNPMVNNDGYEWTENFDGKLIKNDIIYYFNLKFICDSGGSQTRSLREVYHFIKYQLEYLLIFKINNVYFINILDGNTCFNNNDKYKYLVNKQKYENIKKYIFIGDTYEFQINKIKLLL